MANKKSLKMRRSRRQQRKTIRKRDRKQTRKGGALTGAPLDYTMGPGANVAVYGRFPTEIATAPGGIQNLDVFYNSALSRGCGVENSSRYVPVDMGSNKVGGKRTRRGVGRRSRKAMRGGNLLSSLAIRNPPYLAAPYPGPIQSVSQSWAGATSPVPVPATPVYQTWNFKSSGTDGAINPGIITSISKDLTQLASPPPWQTTA